MTYEVFWEDDTLTQSPYSRPFAQCLSQIFYKGVQCVRVMPELETAVSSPRHPYEYVN